MSIGRIALSIKNKLEFLNPLFLEILNESNKHNVPPGSESHFKGSFYFIFTSFYFTSLLFLSFS